jgi:ATP-dependent Lhr-like helicase
VTDAADALAGFSPVTRAWFEAAFAEPTPAQAGAWAAIREGRHTLVVAPTGSGKTLAAFLWALDRLAAEPRREDPGQRCRVLYVSPLKALAVDVERNLRSPLHGIRREAQRQGLPPPDITVGMRSGDTPADERRRLATKPPDVLITTPESLFLILTSRAREALRGIETVIVDEVHAVAGTKRGAHLALTLERLDALLAQPAQRIGLSATVRPVDEVARFLGGARPASVVQPPSPKTIEVEVVVPVEDMAELADQADEPDPRARRSIWPAVEERVADLVEAHRSTIVFANSRRLAERLTARLNEIAYERRYGEPLPHHVPPAQLMAQSDAAHGSPEVLARAHHGSVSKEQRAVVEEELKAGRLPAVVATSSLELGIDMGAVDLVVQVEAPPSVASGLQRIGRAGHQVGAVSRGVVLPKYRGDLLSAAVVAERMRAGDIEPLHPPRNALDVLAQQIVAMGAVDEWDVEELLALVRRATPFSTLPSSAFEAVLDMLAGRYPSDEFAELRPRIVWDRVQGRIAGRPGAQRLAVTSGGTIPDRGLFGVFLAGDDEGGRRGGRRVGELDEEMVYESRVGDVFTLGSTSWRIEDITHDRVLVSPAPGQPGRLPFWKGDTAGRPVELGRALGGFVRELAGLPPDAALARLAAAGLDRNAASNLLAYLDEQRQATGYVPDDRTIVVERFRDELGDWRIALHSPFGARVHAPWALALAGRLRERYGVDVQAMHADDGIVLRLPDTEDVPAAGMAVLDPAEVDQVVTAEVGTSALFAARFRECAARALLLPRRDPGRRSPLWQQRQRSAQLLAVASRYPTFPIVLEAMRECLQDVFDLPGLVGLMRDVEARRLRIVDVETVTPSPFARSLLFGYVGAFIYDGDAPLAERRAQALALDSALLAELLGEADLRELLDAEAVAEVEAELTRTAPDRWVRSLEATADLLRLLGDLTTAEAAERGADPAWLDQLASAHRALQVRVAGEDRWVAAEDAGRLRDSLGVALPVGVPEAFLEPGADPLGDVVARYARTHGPFVAGDLAARYGLGVAVVDGALGRLAAQGRVVHGEFRPGGAGGEWCDAEVLRRLRRRSLARLRREIEPVPQVALARFLPGWQGVDRPGRRGVDGVFEVAEQLAGAALPASALESLVLPARVADYRTGLLDELTASGELIWAGHGALPGGDGWLALYPAETAPLLLPAAAADSVRTPVHRAVLEALDGGAALFFRGLVDRVSAAAHSEAGSPTGSATGSPAGSAAGSAAGWPVELPVDDATVGAAVWDLVWGGWLTNDTLAPLRAGLGRRPVRVPSTARRRPRMPSRTGPPTLSGRWSRLPLASLDATRRAQAAADALLNRHGVLLRGAVAAERVSGGFAGVYPVRRAFEEAGRARRGYFVEGLGAAQFALAGAVDRLRAGQSGQHESSRAVVLAAADPANPYGAALGWPEVEGGHRPGRKAGAVVVLVDGALVLYVERGGRSLLSFTAEAGEAAEPSEPLRLAAKELAGAVHRGALGRLTVERVDGATVRDTPLAEALREAGFVATPRGLRLRG